MTSCFVYKVMGVTYHERINTQLIYRFELAQVVARRISKPRISLATLFLFSLFFLLFLGGGGGGGGVLILLFCSCLIFLFLFYFF